LNTYSYVSWIIHRKKKFYSASILVDAALTFRFANEEEIKKGHQQKKQEMIVLDG